MKHVAIKIHWSHSQGPEAIFPLAMSHDRESICIDKDAPVEAILRLVMAQKGIEPTEDFRVHCWLVQTGNTKHYFFVDDEQNDVVKQGVTTACSTKVVGEETVC